MQTRPDDFTGDAWATLSERVQEHAEPWLKLLRHDEREYGGPDEADRDKGTSRYVKQILWLIPLATVLQQRTELHELYPMVHHAVIEIKRLPHSTPQREFFTFKAETEGVFRLSTAVRPSNPPGWQCQELGMGDAEQVVQRLVDVVQSLKPPS